MSQTVTTPNGDTYEFPDGMKPAKIQELMRRHALGPAGGAEKYLPALGGIAGGLVGSIGGPPGAIVGAGMGGAAGEGLRRVLRHEPYSPLAVGGQGLLQAGLEVGGLTIGAAAKGIAKAPAPIVRGAARMFGGPAGKVGATLHEVATKLGQPQVVKAAEEVPERISKLLDQYERPIVHPAQKIPAEVVEARKLKLLDHPEFRAFMRMKPKVATRVIQQFFAAQPDATNQ